MFRNHTTTRVDVSSISIDGHDIITLLTLVTNVPSMGSMQIDVTLFFQKKKNAFNENKIPVLRKFFLDA